MRVLKFGGGCLRDAACFIRAAEIVRAEEGPRAVVVSAVSGVTDALARGVCEAARDDAATAGTLTAIREKHMDLLDGALKAGEVREDVRTALEGKLMKLEKLLMAVSYAGEASPSLRANILSTGERLAAVLLSGAVRAAGVPSTAWESDEIGMVTEEASDNATVDIDAFRGNVSPLARLIFHAGGVPVITGFFGRTPAGRVAMFGRNGSDYSAAVVAAVLEAARLEIWKDVGGFMSADPDLVPEAVPVPSLSWREAAELAYFGAKIVHPRTFEPLAGREIEVVIKSFADPGGPGTELRAEGSETETVVKSVTSNDRIARIRVRGPGVGIKPGIVGRIGRGLADAGINIHSVITSQTCINLLVDRADAQSGAEEVRKIANGVVRDVELEEDIALVAVVGEGLLRRTGVAARVFSAVSRAGINVEIISMGASEVAAYFVVRRGLATKAVRAVHGDFFPRPGGSDGPGMPISG
jgi:bifunctional aspartokinase / homoserine dehydrogenase 1